MGEKVNPADETGRRARRHGLECPLDVKQGQQYNIISFLFYFLFITILNKSNVSVAQWIVLFLFSAYNGIIVLPSLDLLPLSISVLSVIFLR